MPNLFNSLRECLGFSHTMKLTNFKIFTALGLISSRFPIGVQIIYNPLSIFSILIISIFIVSCVPVNNSTKPEILVQKTSEKLNQISEKNQNKKNINKKSLNLLNNYKVSNEIGVSVTFTRQQQFQSPQKQKRL